MESPIVTTSNYNPLHLSFETRIAYWFERSIDGKLVYREVPLDSFVDEPLSIEFETEN